jgi:NitT/TauT family transport system ATP-binding protein
MVTHGSQESGATSATAQEPMVSVRGVSRVHGTDGKRVLALERIDLEVAQGELVCVVGASGCGKSTLLHMIAGLDQPTSGELAVRGGQVAMLFQDAALFPWLSVAENVAFPLKTHHVKRAARRKRVAELLELVRLTPFADHRPHQLSGGMRQRCALARALAQEAKILLMDEPFGALDALIRDRLHDELERIWRSAGLTIVFVTHSPREAVRLADRVLLMSSRPGRFVDEFVVDLPRPRRIDSRVVSALAATITDRLKEVIHASDGNDD